MAEIVRGPGEWGMSLARAPAAVAASREPIPRMFSWHDAHPVALSVVLHEKFGNEWIGWEPETLRNEITTAFKVSSISENNWQKIQACRTLYMSTAFWEAWEVFEKVLQALNNNVPRFDVGQPCTLAQLMAGVDMSATIRRKAFGEDIQNYVAACAVHDGVTYLPEPLDFAQKALSRPVYRCLDCGNEDVDDLEDGRCDFCCGRFDDWKNLNFEPKNGVPDEAGRNIEKKLTRDPEPARKRFEDLKSASGEIVVDEDIAEDVQAAKLMVAYRYMLLRRRQLAEQLKELKSWVTH